MVIGQNLQTLALQLLGGGGQKIALIFLVIIEHLALADQGVQQVGQVPGSQGSRAVSSARERPAAPASDR